MTLCISMYFQICIGRCEKLHHQLEKWPSFQCFNTQIQVSGLIVSSFKVCIWPERKVCKIGLAQKSVRLAWLRSLLNWLGPNFC